MITSMDLPQTQEYYQLDAPPPYKEVDWQRFIHESSKKTPYIMESSPRQVPLSEYLASLPGIKEKLAMFWGTGNGKCLDIANEDFHHYLHVAHLARDDKLVKKCFEFYKVRFCEGEDLINRVEYCDCKNVLQKEIEKAIKIEKSIKRVCACESGQRCNGQRQFAVLFLTKKNPSVKQQVSVMDSSADGIRTFDQKVSKVSKLGKDFAACSCHISDAPYVFVSGGRAGKSKGSKKVLKYDVLEGHWKTCADMHHGRSKHISVEVDNQVYFIGGESTGTIERFDPRANKCKVIGDLFKAVHSAECAVFGDKIFIFGGKSGNENVTTVQCIHTKNDIIEKLADLPFPCSGGHAVVFGDTIYIATGQGRMIWFDPETGSSQLCAQQPCIRKHFILTVCKSEILLVGGVSGGKKLETAENCICKYSPDKDSWRVGSPSLSNPLPVYTSCVVKYHVKCPFLPFDKTR